MKRIAIGSCAVIVTLAAYYTLSVRVGMAACYDVDYEEICLQGENYPCPDCDVNCDSEFQFEWGGLTDCVAETDPETLGVDTCLTNHLYLLCYRTEACEASLASCTPEGGQTGSGRRCISDETGWIETYVWADYPTGEWCYP